MRATSELFAPENSCLLKGYVYCLLILLLAEQLSLDSEVNV